MNQEIRIKQDQHMKRARDKKKKNKFICSLLFRNRSFSEANVHGKNTKSFLSKFSLFFILLHEQRLLSF